MLQNYCQTNKPESGIIFGVIILNINIKIILQNTQKINNLLGYNSLSLGGYPLTLPLYAWEQVHVFALYLTAEVVTNLL